MSGPRPAWLGSARLHCMEAVRTREPRGSQADEVDASKVETGH